MTERVIILGAGFSRAISPRIPLTDELGDLVLARLGQEHPAFSGGYFEMWLSRLAEPQPDLTEDVNSSNRGLFLRITAALHAILIERELEILIEPPPPWLLRLVGVLHAKRSTVITFNYDTLVEKAVDMRRPYDWQQAHPAGSNHVLNNLPPEPFRPGLRFGPSPADSFSLLKLHGSLDDYWVLNDRSGATINHWNSLGSWGSPVAPDERQRVRELPDRTPFIVPPAAAKSAFYSNPITRQLWQSAAAALASADTISLVGYSLPPTDLVTSGMLADSLADRPVRLEVVNPHPNDVVNRLIALGARTDLIGTIPGYDAVELFADQFERESAGCALDSLLACKEDGLVLAAAQGNRAAAVREIDVTGEVVRLKAVSPGGMEDARRPDFFEANRPITLSSLQAQIREANPSDLVVTIDGSFEVRVVDFVTAPADGTTGYDSWAVLALSVDPG